MFINKISARRIKDSRGQDTIEVSVNDDVASAPNGKSTGRFETKPYLSGLDYCVRLVNSFDFNFEIKSFGDLFHLERVLKRNLKINNAKKIGANTLFAFECAVLKALAKSEERDLWEVINPMARRFPRPAGNVIGGGMHSMKNSGRPEFQEFLIIPEAKSFSKNAEIINFVHSRAGRILNVRKKNDEGAWIAGKDNGAVLDLMNDLRLNAEKKFKEKVGIGIDVAASSFYKNGRYVYKEKNMNCAGQLKFMEEIIYNYDLCYLEDPLEQEDYKRFSKLTEKSGNCMIVGDDLIATQIERLDRAIKHQQINAVIIKPNQNGSLVELKEIFDICRKKNIRTVMSHRSGETMDSALADLAFGFGADYIKCGISGREREVKLKRMIEIEKSLN